MIQIPEIDSQIKELVQNKKIVLYTANSNGEFPHSFTKSFVPSAIPINLEWYVGYTPFIIEGFNMIEISYEISQGLQMFNIENGTFKRYDRYGLPNENDEKLEIIMTEVELSTQVKSKKFVLKQELKRLYDTKINLEYQSYGREADSWNIQLEEAKMFISDKSSDVPFIRNISEIRGVDLQLFVDTILKKADLFNKKLSSLIGNKQKLSDLIEKTTDNKGLNLLISKLNNV